MTTSHQRDRRQEEEEEEGDVDLYDTPPALLVSNMCGFCWISTLLALEFDPSRQRIFGGGVMILTARRRGATAEFFAALKPVLRRWHLIRSRRERQFEELLGVMRVFAPFISFDCRLTSSTEPRELFGWCLMASPSEKSPLAAWVVRRDDVLPRLGLATSDLLRTDGRALLAHRMHMALNVRRTPEKMLKPQEQDMLRTFMCVREKARVLRQELLRDPSPPPFPLVQCIHTVLAGARRFISSQRERIPYLLPDSVTAPVTVRRCCSICLRGTGDDDDDGSTEDGEDAGLLDCLDCLDMCSTPCGHTFCGVCIQWWSRTCFNASSSSSPDNHTPPCSVCKRALVSTTAATPPEEDEDEDGDPREGEAVAPTRRADGCSDDDKKCERSVTVIVHGRLVGDR